MVRENVSNAGVLRKFDRVLLTYSSICQVFVKTVMRNVV